MKIVPKASLMAGKERMTPQKRLILDYLCSVKTHPSAETVYNEVQKKLPGISQGTVYRVLNNFKQKGQVLAIETKEMVHFDGDTSDHAHFICENCDRVIDVMDQCSKCGTLKSKKIKAGTIKSFKVNFYGICNDCKILLNKK